MMMIRHFASGVAARLTSQEGTPPDAPRAKARHQRAMRFGINNAQHHSRARRSADRAVRHDGYVRIDNAFPADVAAECRRILWADTGCDPDDPATWTRPVIRLGNYTQPPFVAAANTPLLHAAFDQLVGPGKWYPLGSLGTFPIRPPRRMTLAMPAGTSM